MIAEREKDLQHKFDEIMEKDMKHKEEKEIKRMEHEEDMFIADLQKAYDKERAAGKAKKAAMKQMKEMENTIQQLDERMEK